MEEKQSEMSSYERLKALILDHKIDAGRRLTEAYLAELLGLSRIPVREAVQQLMLEGFIERSEKNGYRIKEYNPQDVIDLYYYREALDGMLARLFTSRMDDSQLYCLEMNLQSMRSMLEAYSNEGFDQKAYSRIDQEFHRIIARGARNPHMEQQHELILEKVIYIAGLAYRDHREDRKDIYNKDNFQSTYNQHRMIFEAIRAEDPDKAEEVARHSVRDGLKKTLHIIYSQY